MFKRKWPVSDEFKTKVIDIATKLKMDPDHLMAVMAFETGGKFKANTKNMAGSGATGLIQFMPATAKGLGTSVEELAKMTEIEQLDYVYKYLRPFAGKMKTLEDAYMAVLYPAACGKGPNHVLFRRGTITYKQNAGLDINKNGFITVGEAAAKVRSKLESYKEV